MQFSKSAKNLKESTILSSDLEDVQAIAANQESEYEPEADAIRGALSIRRLSTLRRPSHRKSSTTHSHRIYSTSTGYKGPGGTPLYPEPLDIQTRMVSVRFDPSQPATQIYPFDNDSTSNTDFHQPLPFKHPLHTLRESQISPLHTEESEEADEDWRSSTDDIALNPLTEKQNHPYRTHRNYSFARPFSPHRRQTTSEEEHMGLVSNDTSAAEQQRARGESRVSELDFNVDNYPHAIQTPTLSSNRQTRQTKS